jgi:hypothetical protein
MKIVAWFLHFPPLGSFLPFGLCSKEQMDFTQIQQQLLEALFQYRLLLSLLTLYLPLETQV